MTSRPGSKEKVAAGKLLIAEPFMTDPYFSRSVILLCDHSAEGSLGFIINKPLDVRLNDILAGFPVFDVPAHYGGPVQTDTIHFLHNVGDLLDDSVPVTSGIWWGGNFEKLKFLVDNHLILPDNIRFFVGYSGWSEGQLEDEMKIGSWVLGEPHPNYVFREEPGNLWQMALDHKGGLYAVIGHMPEENVMN